MLNKATMSSATINQNTTSLQSAQIIKSIGPKHSALSRLHAELKNEGGTASITAYDRMHHRHNRS
jgi:hypothetical protein